MTEQARKKELKYLVGLHQIEGVDQKILAMLMDYFESAEKAWRSTRQWRDILPLTDAKIDAMVATRSRLNLDIIDNYREQCGVSVTTEADDDFPAALRNIYSPPYLLYYLGELPAEDRLRIAVVGARSCDDYGKAATDRIVTDLVEKADVHIVSGMAEGVDGVAHKAAIRAGGTTTAVLGSGIDNVYPACHRKLYEDIREHGCVLSEWPFGYPPLRENFPIRNRLISGLSHGVVVTRARKRSGAAHTVRHGLDQGKEIFAVPGSILSGLSEYPHDLIEMGEAKFTACAEDILEEFLDIGYVEQMRHSDEVKAFAFAATEAEKAVVFELQRGRRTFDELAEVSHMKAAELTTFLTRLEIEGAIRETPGNTYTLNE